MRVTAKLYGDLRRRLPKGEESITLVLPVGAAVGDFGRAIGFEDGEVWKVSIDGQLVEEDHALRDGDTVLFFPPIEGGSEP